jgi:prevent-host-death family protein
MDLHGKQNRRGEWRGLTVRDGEVRSADAQDRQDRFWSIRPNLCENDGMPTVVSLYVAKTHLSELGERAANGEEIVVTKHGKPRFRLVEVQPARRRPGPGGDRLAVSAIADDFDAPDEELERLFGTND